MCAIAGIVKMTTDLPQNTEQLLASVLQAMQHRGPDGQGIEVDFVHQTAFAQARLAIIDLSPAGRQPFMAQPAGVSLVFNGEIYNYRQLRAELEQLGHRFFTNTDTEVLLQAYLCWGSGFLDHLHGMFAVAIFDPRDQSWLLARDRIGAKPLFFTLQGGYLAFASEVGALLTLPWVKAKPDLQAFYHYLTFMAVPVPRTKYLQLYKLPAGFCVRLDARRKLSFWQWYCPVIAVAKKQAQLPKNLSFAAAVELVRQALVASVKQRLVSDAPVAIFLSGGLDSSLILAISAGLGVRLNSFNVAFEGAPEHDERRWARLAARLFGAAHHEFELNAQAVQSLEQQALELGRHQPLGDCVNVPLLALAKACRAKGFKVALVGEGADELFFGYPEYLAHQRVEQFFKAWSLHSWPQLAKNLLVNIAAKLPLRPGLKAVVNHWQQQVPLYWGGAIAFYEHQKIALKQQLSKLRQNCHDSAQSDDCMGVFAESLESDFVVRALGPRLDGQELDSGNYLRGWSQKVADCLPEADFGQRLALFELQHRLPELLLARVDSVCMAAGVEGREPLLEHSLVELVLALPARFRSNGQGLKTLLKAVAAHFLPASLIFRAKKGFGAPLSQWPNKRPKAVRFKVHPTSALQGWVLSRWEI